MENLYASTGQGADGGAFRSDLHDTGRERDSCFYSLTFFAVTEWCLFPRGDLRSGRVEEADVILQRSEGGVDSALLYAKTISKYMKDLISYVEKRISLGECLFTPH